MVEAIAVLLTLYLLEERRKEEQPFVLYKTCSVLSGHAWVLPVDRGSFSL